METYIFMGVPLTPQIDARNMTFTETFNLDNNTNVRLKGGLAADFVTVNGCTSLQGILTVLSGSLTVENLCVKVRVEESNLRSPAKAGFRRSCSVN